MSPRRVRPVRDADYEPLAALFALHEPDEASGAADLRRFDGAFRPPNRLHRLVADDGGGALGTAAAMQLPGSYHPRRFFVEVLVHPDARGRGFGRELYAALLDEIADARPQRLRLRAKAADARSVALAERYGYRETKRDWTSTLELDRLEGAPAAAAERLAAERLAAMNLRITDLARLERERGVDAARRLAYQAFVELRRDVPRAEPATDLSFDEYRRFVLEDAGFVPDALFLVLRDDEIVGFTQLFRTEEEERFATGLTAVRRAWRGRGVATAVKRHALHWARRRGARWVTTDNDTTNAAMLAVNDRLGFQRGEAWLSLLLELDDGGFDDHRTLARAAAEAAG